MSGYIQRLEYLREYFHGDKPVNTIIQAPMIVELLDSVIKDVKALECPCKQFSYKTYTGMFRDIVAGQTVDRLVYAGHYHCGAKKALATTTAKGLIYTWEGGRIINIEDINHS